MGLGSIIGGASGVLGGIIGGISKNKTLSRMADAIRSQQRDNQNWFDRRYNEDSTQRADAQRLLAITEEALKKRTKGAAGTAAVMGSSQEAIAAEKEAATKMMSDTVSQIAANNERRKDAIENQYMQRKQDLDNQLLGINSQKKSGWDIAADAISGGVAGIGGGLGL